MRWNQVMNFSDLQYWLEERDVSISRIAKAEDSEEWEVEVECNSASTPLMHALGRTAKDFEEEPESCGVAAIGVDLYEALRCALHETDECLDEMEDKDEDIFGSFARPLQALRQEVMAGRETPLQVAAKMRAVVDAIRKAKEKGVVTLADVPACQRFGAGDYRGVIKDMLPQADDAFIDAVVIELEKEVPPASP